MQKSHELALVIGYYLSRFDQEGVRLLGYKSFNAAVQDISKKLSVKANTLKNMRDEFDPYHDNGRVGWYQRPVTGSRKRVMLAFRDLDEPAVRSIVTDILSNPLSSPDEVTEIVADDTPEKRTAETIFIPRGPTGRKAEEFFLHQHIAGNTRFSGELKDTRDLGCGYDFAIGDGQEAVYIEVKGLSEDSGGISFTNKEWMVANEKGEAYVLALVSNIDSAPRISYLSNPAKKLSARKQIYRTISISWNVSNKNLRGDRPAT